MNTSFDVHELQRRHPINSRFAHAHCLCNVILMGMLVCSHDMGG